MTLSGTTTSPAPRRVRVRLAGVLAAVLAVVGVVAWPSAALAVSDSSAASQLSAAGISRTSSGGCTSPSGSTCTSYEGIRQATIDGAITLKRASGCALTITGGTETGHAGGTYSHATGYKLDFSRTSCLTSWVHSAYTSIGPRAGDGAAQYQASSGNVYADEGSHWDVVFYTCGC